MKRCAWCARFVKADTEITCWRVHGIAPESRQVASSDWNYWCRTLCPDCAECTRGGRWERATFAEYIRHIHGYDIPRALIV